MLRVKIRKLHAAKCDKLFIRECLHETQVNWFTTADKNSKLLTFDKWRFEILQIGNYCQSN